jgi:hypothetical protein
VIRIHKYALAVRDVQEVTFQGRPTRFLSVGEQRGDLVMWVEVDEDGGDHSETIYVLGTGFPVHNLVGDHLGTVQIDGLVWHVFREHEIEVPF